MRGKATETTVAFPEDFVWGAATSAYQVEGAVAEAGRGPSVWDVFARAPGNIWLNQTADIACDHFHRYRDDVAHMKSIGLNAYRFSIAWPRVVPDGAGEVCEHGLDFYDRLVDALLESGIVPYATLYHWDLPYALHCRGGWLNRDIASWFAAYAHAVCQRLGDRVRHWFTFNEPQIFLGLGYERGTHAPGQRLAFHELLRSGHHVLLAHGMAAQGIRAVTPGRCSVGYAPHAVVFIPESEREEDVRAAASRMFSFSAKTCWSNTWWSDPMFFGRYPDDLLEQCAAEMPAIEATDMAVIHQPPDFYGMNLYAGAVVRAGREGPEDVPWPANVPVDAFKMAVTPEAMYWGARFFFERYGKPILISENGSSCHNWVSLDGNVHDPQRIDYTARYLLQLARAIRDGVPVLGYFHWSLLDNFEWSEGYKERLGLLYVDFDTQERVWKDSAYWYQRIIASHGAILGDPVISPRNPGPIT